MKKAYTKTIYRCLLASILILVSQALDSCIKDEEVVTSPMCAITSFSVGSIKSEVTTQKYDKDGNAIDTTITKTIGGSEIFFNIDQLNGKITTVSKLPKWVDLRKVVPSFSCYGNVFGQIGSDSLYYVLSSGKDSIDFTKPVNLICVASDGISTKKYTVEILKSESDLTVMEWNKAKACVDMKGVKKLYVSTLNTYAFAKDEEGRNIVNVNFNAASTELAKRVEMPKSDLDCNSVLMFRDKFYAIDSEGIIYSSNLDKVGESWEKVSEKKVERLLCTDDVRLYAYDGEAIVGTSDMETWEEFGKANLDMLPEICISAASYKTKTNNDLYSVVMTGISSNNHRNDVAWYKVTSSEKNVDQDWAYIQVTAENSYGLPRLENLSMARSKGALYAIGMKDGKYECLYRSQDNGLTWKELDTETYPLPEGFIAENGAALLIGSENQLWIYQENGTVWEGLTL